MPEPDYTVPEKPSGLVVVPDLSITRDVLEANAAVRRDWAFQVGGFEAVPFIERARRSSIDAAEEYCARRGIPFGRGDGPLLVTGHQPMLFHPGVWAKTFLVDVLANSVGGTALNLVVDSDEAGEIVIDAPRADDGLLTMSRRQIVPRPEPGAPYESVEVPDAGHLGKVCDRVGADLRTLPARDASEAFAKFAAALAASAESSASVGEMLTRTRRAYEAPVRTAYLELPVSLQCGTDEFLTFFLAVAERIEQFRDIYNECLAQYRERYEVRSGANPFPDLGKEDDMVESPFWLMDSKGLRATLWLKRQGASSMVCHADGCKVELMRGEYADNIVKLRSEGIQIRPKALVLTLFNRLFVADLFLHGMGGAKYDRITDEIARRFLGAEPPGYLAATATFRLDTGLDAPSGASLAELSQRLHALEHNPDRFTDDASVDEALRPRLAALASEKADLVERIAREGADKKALGGRIRDVNRQIAQLLAPLREATQRAVAAAGQMRESERVAAYREFPFCYWQPEQVQQLVLRAVTSAGLRGEE